MSTLRTLTDAQFDQWLAATRTEDELRDAYLQLEAERAALWQRGTLESFRRDRYDRDAVLVRRLVRVKWHLARLWETTGQFEGLVGEPQHA